MKATSKKVSLFFIVTVCFLSASCQLCFAKTLTVDEVRAITKEAYLYANPIADNYRIMHAYFVDQENPEYKAPWNQIKNIARVFTSDDKMIQAANSDTPYSFIALDLRSEPMILTVPAMEKNRYFSVQLSDMYTQIFDYIGTRTTGNNGGSFLIAGPGWKGKTPEGITKVIQSETQLALAGYRTQLFNPKDLENVKKIQRNYIVRPLSVFLGQPAPKAAPAINFIKPLTPDEIRKSPHIFTQLNFILQFCPIHKSEQELMKRFAKINIVAGKTFDPSQFSQQQQAAMAQGIADAWADFMDLKTSGEARGITAADLYGSRELLQNNYLYRMSAAVFGIYGNAAQEASYLGFFNDSDGQTLNGTNRYILRFAPDQLPPVNAFWSMTMYELPANVMTPNPINRYLLNSPMLPDFKKDADGNITFYIQHDTPGSHKEANWLPSPKSGPFSLYFRMYWPKQEVLDGKWTAPAIQRIKE